MKPLSWKPRRSGHIYCSPACGGNCTYRAFESANDQGRTLARRLGPHWKSSVWENLGWHYSAVYNKGEVRASVHEYKYKENIRYWASVWLGGRQWTSKSFKDPRRAFNLAVNDATKHLADLTRDLQKIGAKIPSIEQVRKAAHWLAQHKPGTPVPDWVDRAINS